MDSIIFLIIIGGAIAFVIGIYNRLIGLRNKVRNGFAQVDVELTRRYDLIPNLVASVQAYMTHERETLDAVVKARNSATKDLQRSNPDNPGSIAELGMADAALTAGLGKLFALMESYPDLKANQNMLTLQGQLATTENKVAFARQAFNDAVNAYNTSCESFPANLFTNLFGFKPAAFFTVESADQRAAPKVAFT
jgi:LemA protein